MRRLDERDTDLLLGEFGLVQRDCKKCGKKLYTLDKKGKKHYCNKCSPLSGEEE